MKKTLLLLPLILVIFLCTGCTTVQIDCGIDASYNAYLKCNINIDTSALNEGDKKAIKTSVYNLVRNFEGSGYKAKHNIFDDEDKIIIELERIKNESNFNDAFAELKLMLENPKLTPFISVDMQNEITQWEEAYRFKATADFNDIIDQASIEQLPSDLKDLALQSLEESKGTITFTLPGNEVVSYNGELTKSKEFYSVTVPVDFNNSGEIELVTRLNAEEGLLKYISTEKSVQIKTFIIWGCIFLFCIGVVLFILSFYIRKKNKKKSDINVETNLQ